MNNGKKRVGILTFHASYNCGSMLQAFALQTVLEKHGYYPKIIDFSSEGQKRLYSIYSKNNSLKNIVRNSIFFCHRKKIRQNYHEYEQFKQQHFALTESSWSKGGDIIDEYDVVIAGADQIWNITISDYDDAYFLPWVKTAKRIAYAPSFGAKNPMLYSDDVEKHKKFLRDFDALSIREKNGQRWIDEMIGKKVPVVLDPTLLIEESDYAHIVSGELELPKRYIFYYSPTYSLKINELVTKISHKYNLPVIAFNTKSFYLRGMDLRGFRLPSVESPSTYLQLMKNASLVITTSFHGSIFSTIFRKDFWVIKNGGMFDSDDRVATLLEQLGMEDRLISMEYDDGFDYIKHADYAAYDGKLPQLKAVSEGYLLSALEGCL